MNLDQSLTTINLLNNKKVVAPRDWVFQEALNLFGGKPVNILQVGAIETFNSNHLIGSGWSDRFFGPYVKEFGGHYRIIDIDLDHLANSLMLSEILGYKVELNLDSGEAGVQPGFDLYYLDGSNDPQEMLVEVDNIRKHPCVILCDDWDIKGTLVRPLFDWKIFSVANGMAMIDLRKTPASPV